MRADGVVVEIAQPHDLVVPGVGDVDVAAAVGHHVSGTAEADADRLSIAVLHDHDDSVVTGVGHEDGAGRRDVHAVGIDEGRDPNADDAFDQEHHERDADHVGDRGPQR